MERSLRPRDAYDERRCVLPVPPSASMRSTWWGPIARMRSLPLTSSRVSSRARCADRSTERSIATSRAPSEAGAPSHAAVPALPTEISDRLRSAANRRASASAIGLRQVLPVQTKSTRIGSGISNQVGHALAQRGGGDRSRAYHSGARAGAIYYRGRLGGGEAPAVEHAQNPASHWVAPL